MAKAAAAHPPAGLVLAASSDPPIYIVTLTATPHYVPSVGISTSISYPNTFLISVLPKGCSYFALYGVSCNVVWPADTITISFAQVIASKGGPAKFDAVVMNGDTCTLASQCSAAIPSPLPPTTSQPPVTTPAQSSGVVPPVVSSTLFGSNGPTAPGSQPTNLRGTETGGRNDGAQPTASSNSDGGAGEIHTGKSETGMIVGSTVGAAVLVLLSSLVIIKRQKRAATTAAAAAAVAAAATSAASSTEGSPSMDPRDPPWDERPSRVAAAATALWAALMDPKRMSPRIPTMTAPWNRVYLSNNPGAGVGTGPRTEKNPQAILERHVSVQTASDQSSVFGILDAYGTQEKDNDWPSRENSISRNPALAAAVCAVKDLSMAAAAGNIRHERVKKGGTGVGVVVGAGVGSGGVGTTQTLLHIPDNGAHAEYEDENYQLDFMDSTDYHHVMQDVALAPSTNVSSDLTMVSGPSTPPPVPSSPLINARARLFQAVSLASSRLRRQVSRHSWYGSPIQPHAEVAAVEEEQQQQQEQQQAIKLPGPRYPKDNIAFTRPVRNSFYKRQLDSNTNSGIFVTSIRAEHHDQQLQEDVKDNYEPPVQSANEFDFTNPGPPRMLPTRPSIITNAPIVRATLYVDNNINNSDSQLYNTNLNNFRNSTVRRGYSQPIVMRSEEIRIVRVEPPHTAEILPVKPPSRYSRDPRAVPTKYEESPVYANGLYGFM